MMRSLLDQAETETRAALEGALQILDDAALSVDASLIALRVYGDALRLGVEAPSPVRRWAEARGPALLDDVLRSAFLLVDAAALPRGPIPGAALDPALPGLVRDRDHAESVLQAVRRAWLPRAMTQLSGYVPLLEGIATTDAALARLLTRAETEAMLGARVALGASWTRSFPEPAELEPGGSLAILPLPAPSPSIVARYIEGGLLQSLVESSAEADPDRAEALATAIDALAAAGEAGFFARSWLRKHRTGAAAAAAFCFGAPPLAYAAASADEDDAGERHRLGKLFAAIDAEASLFVGEREIRVELDFAPGAIARLVLGDEERRPAPEDSTCRIAIPRGGASVRFEVASSAGEIVAETLSFAVVAP